MTTTTKKICPICEEGQISEKVADKKFSYHGKQFIVRNYVTLRCNSCSEEFVAEKYDKKLSLIIAEEQRKIDEAVESH